MAESILQGTTPTLTVEIDPAHLSLADVTELELTFQQHNKEPTIRHLTDCVLDLEENTVAYHFSETETHAFHPSFPLRWQLRFVTLDGQVLGTKWKEIEIEDLISKEILTE